MGAVLLALAAGCATTASLRPSWIGTSKLEDDAFFYVDGMSSGHMSPENAQAAARDDALRRIEERLLGGASPTRGRRLPPEILNEARVLDEGYYTERDASGYRAWARTRFPRDTARNLHQRLAEGRAVNDLWTQATKRSQAGDYAGAVDLLEKLVEGYADPVLAEVSLAEARAKLAEMVTARDRAARRAHLQGLWDECETLRKQTRYGDAIDKLAAFLKSVRPGDPLPVPVETVKLTYADLLRGQARDFEAYRWYSDLAKSGTREIAAKARAALNAMPMTGTRAAWPLNDRWKRRKVALAAVWDQGQGPAVAPRIAAEMVSFVSEARLEHVDLSDRALGGDLAEQRSGRSALVEEARAAGAGVLWMIVLSTNPDERGKTTSLEIAGEKISHAAFDTDREIVVVDVERGQPLYVETMTRLQVGHDISDQRVAELTAQHAVAKYLVPKCPALP